MSERRVGFCFMLDVQNLAILEYENIVAILEYEKIGEVYNQFTDVLEGRNSTFSIFTYPEMDKFARYVASRHLDDPKFGETKPPAPCQRFFLKAP